MKDISCHTQYEVSVRKVRRFPATFRAHGTACRNPPVHWYAYFAYLKAQLSPFIMALICSNIMKHKTSKKEYIMSIAVSAPLHQESMSFIERTVKSCRKFLENRNTCSELASLSDHELKDIGLTRADIPHLFEIRRRG